MTTIIIVVIIVILSCVPTKKYGLEYLILWGQKMCKWGQTEPLEILIGNKKKKVDIDRCVFPIVKALNDAGITTLASCCGHGKQNGSIVLADGRELVIRPSPY